MFIFLQGKRYFNPLIISFHTKLMLFDNINKHCYMRRLGLIEFKCMHTMAAHTSD